MCLPREFNAVFGDPSFGNEKILIVDYHSRCVAGVVNNILLAEP
jgi:hypothetical protein